MPRYLYNMNLSGKLAWRYLFARKSTNAINIITLIAAFGVAIGAAALLLLLSVFNGLEDLIMGMYDNLNPDVEITAARGKTFEVGPDQVVQLNALPGVATVAGVLEETAWFSYNGKQSAARMKGVSLNYAAVNGIDSLVRDGAYTLGDPSQTSRPAIVTGGLSISLGIDPLNKIERLTAFTLRPRPRGSGGSFISGRSNYKRRDFRPAGVIPNQGTTTLQTVLVDIADARSLLGVNDSTVSSLALRLRPGADIDDARARVQNLMGPDFNVRDRLEQQQDIYAIIAIEKWVCFAIASLMMVLISFNLIGALWMIVLEKKRDIAILRSLGMTGRNVNLVFVRLGLLLCGLGILLGFTIALLLYSAQKEFALVTLPGMIREAYPIELRWEDFPVVILTVLSIGFLATLLPAYRAGLVQATAE